MAHATTVIATLLDLGQIESCLLTTAAPRAKNFQVINVLLGYQRSLVPPFTGHAPAPTKRTTPTSRARDTPKCPNQGNSLESRRPPTYVKAQERAVNLFSQIRCSQLLPHASTAAATQRPSMLPEPSKLKRGRSNHCLYSSWKLIPRHRSSSTLRNYSMRSSRTMKQ